MENSKKTKIIRLSVTSTQTDNCSLDFRKVRDFLEDAGVPSDELNEAFDSGRHDLIYDALLSACNENHDKLEKVIKGKQMIYSYEVGSRQMEFNC